MSRGGARPGAGRKRLTMAQETHPFARNVTLYEKKILQMVLGAMRAKEKGVTEFAELTNKIMKHVDAIDSLEMKLKDTSKSPMHQSERMAAYDFYSKASKNINK